jgi:transposase
MEVHAEFKFEAVRLTKDRGVSYAQASEHLKAHTARLGEQVLRDPQHAFPGNGRMKLEQLDASQA